MKLLLLISIFISNLCFGEVNSERLELELKIKTSLYQSSLQTQLTLANYFKPLIEKSLQDPDYTEVQISEDIDDLLNRMSINEEGSDKKVKVKIKKGFTNILHEARVVARKEGVGVATLVALNTTLGNMSPFILTALGMPQLILPVNLLLSTAVNVPIAMAFKKGINRVKLVKLYGGKENLKKIKALRKKLKKDFSLEDDMLIFEDDVNGYFSVSTEFSLYNKIMSLFFHSVINPLTLKRTLKKANLWNEDLVEIKKSDIEPSIKSILMITYVIKNFENGKVLLLKRFSHLYSEKGQFNFKADVYEWSLRISEIKNRDDLLAWSKEIPRTASTLEVMHLWQNVILPYMMEKSYDGIKLKSYRYWSKHQDELVSQAELNPISVWNFQWDEKFQDFLAQELE